MNECHQIGEWLRISDLGSGGFGIVSLWRNNDTSENIAIKMCKFKSKSRLSPRQKERWMNEVEIMKKLNHPNIISFKCIPEKLAKGLESTNATKLPLLSMEYCQKGNLRRIIKDLRNGCGLQETEVRWILMDICSAVDYLHKKNITHRDIKPDNIVLHTCNERKNNTIYKLIDLGYAKDLNDTVVSFVGTLEYLAPEICRQLQYNHSVDYWSLGVVAFEIICGVQPFLPGRSYVERYEHLEKKSSDHICIYEDSSSGSYRYSNEILKNYYISRWLKQNIEEWLKHVLHFDPTVRSQNLPNGLTVFQSLQAMLKKRIVTVFSLHKLEFYYYEVNDSTRVDTLKEWIRRDTKIEIKNMLILFSKCVSDIPDDKYVADLLTENNNVYVVQKGSCSKQGDNYVPYYVKELFHRSTFDQKEISKVCHQSIFLLKKENNLLTYVKKSINLFIVYVKNLCLYTKERYKLLNNTFTTLINKSRSTSDELQKQCDNNLRLLDEKKDWLSNYKKLLNYIEAYSNEKKVLQRCLFIEWGKSVELEKSYSVIEKIIKKCDMDQYLQDLIILIEKNKPSPGIDFIKHVRNILNNALRIKDKFLYNEDIDSYLLDTNKVLNNLQALLYNIEPLENIFTQLIKELELSEFLISENFTSIVVPKKQDKIYLKPVKNGYKGKILDYQNLVQENKMLMEHWNVIVNNIFCNDLFLDRF